MPDKKTLGGAAALMLTSALAGAGVVKATAPSLNTTAVLDGVNVGVDGSFGLRVHGAVAGGRYARTLNWDARGANPLIDSQPTSSGTLAQMGPPLANCLAVASAALSADSDELATWTPIVVAPPDMARPADLAHAGLE